MWRVGTRLLPYARFRLLRLAQGSPAVGTETTSQQRSALHQGSMQASAYDGTIGSKAVFCDFPLNRAGHVREDGELQAKLMGNDKAVLVLLNGSTILCEPASNQSSEAPLTLSKLSPLREHCSRVKEPLLFLGVSADGSPYFAAQTLDNSQEIVPLSGMSWVDLRKHSGDLTSADASLAATAHGMLAWHNSCAYSEQTGKHMIPGHAGWARMEDPPESKPTYARLDPAVITVLECNGHLLLGSNLRWATGRFSALAGFVEMGESLEQAASREVFEEAGVHVRSPRPQQTMPSISPSVVYASEDSSNSVMAAQVPPEALRYVESQPWPFPRSLMIAFRGRVAPVSTITDGSQGSMLLQSSDARAAAAESGITQLEIQEYLGAQCTPTAKQEDEMADVRWFHWQWVARTQGWLRPAVVPETDFHVPGPSSLAHRMIKSIVQEQMYWPGAAVPECTIEEGRFKYVLLRVSSADAEHSKLVVRGYKRCEYHNDVLMATKDELYGSGLHVGVIGGGRILHEPGSQPCVTVFGFSSAFGAALHEVSAVIIRRAYPMYDESNVVVCYEGY